jgi:4-hydroxy-tetrahydrodipicolinate reductase
MINIGINGVCGRMGLRIAGLVAEDESLKLVTALEMECHPDMGKDLSSVIGQEHDGVKISHEFSGLPDVLIDFTTPASTMTRLKYCVDNGVAAVIGTTGLDSEQKEEINKASEKIPCLFSPNMSIGVNLLFNLAETVSKILGDESDIEIIE